MNDIPLVAVVIVVAVDFVRVVVVVVIDCGRKRKHLRWESQRVLHIESAVVAVVVAGVLDTLRRWNGERTKGVVHTTIGDLVSQLAEQLTSLLDGVRMSCYSLWIGKEKQPSEP